MVGVATVGRFTDKLNVVVLETPPPEAVTVIGKLPGRVEELVLRVSVEEQLGLQLPCEKEAVAPEGRPEAESVTDCVLPETNVALIKLVTDEPAITDLSPELPSEKLKPSSIVNQALASELGVDPLLNALAFTRVVAATTKGAV
jgi:hypothetical protein